MVNFVPNHWIVSTLVYAASSLGYVLTMIEHADSESFLIVYGMIAEFAFVGLLAYKFQLNKLELFVESQAAAQLLRFIFEHPDPIIVSRNDFKDLNTNEACRKLFQPADEDNLPQFIDPTKPEKGNDWILNTPGKHSQNN